jgi:hypothetical protein
MTAYVPGITETDLKKIVLAIQQLAAGRSNAVGTVTLTTIPQQRSSPRQPDCARRVLGPDPCSRPRPMRQRSSAPARWYISSVALDTFTITHVNSATATRTFPIMPSTVDLVCVDPARSLRFWPQARPDHRAAIERTELSEFADIERRSVRRSASLAGDLDHIEAAATTHLIKTSGKPVCVMTACSGHKRERWLPLFGKIEDYAKAKARSASASTAARAGNACLTATASNTLFWKRHFNGRREQNHFRRRTAPRIRGSRHSLRCRASSVRCTATSAIPA